MTPSTVDIIFSHNNCQDGWVAAFVAKLRYPEAEIVLLNHGNEQDLEQVFSKSKNKHVLMLDYSLRTRELNDRLNSTAASLLILDHHKTAKQILEDTEYAVFDINRSGAGLAWDYLFGKDSEFYKLSVYNPAGFRPRPWWVNYTEDQDLWKHELPDSQSINAFLMIQPRTIEAWKQIEENSFGDLFEYIIDIGSGVRSYIEYYTRSVIPEARYGTWYFRDAEYRVAVVNIPYVGVSEVGNQLVQDCDVAVCWFERADNKIQFSLRSNRKTSNIDVSVIAKHYGGGGHQNAAGFQLSKHAGRELIDFLTEEV